MSSGASLGVSPANPLLLGVGGLLWEDGQCPQLLLDPLACSCASCSSSVQTLWTSRGPLARLEPLMYGSPSSHRGSRPAPSTTESCLLNCRGWAVPMRDKVHLSASAHPC